VSARPPGRPRLFDEEAALERALELFWQRGLAGASLDELAAAMGLGRPSLANAFGDKQALYRRALARFADRARAGAAEARVEPELARALERFYLAALDVYCASDPPAGCLVICTAPAAALVHPEVRADLLAVVRELDAALARRFAQAGDAEPALSAKLAQAVLHTLAIRARAGESKASLRRWLAPPRSGHAVEAGAEGLATAALDHVAVRDGDAVEVPGQDAVGRGARRLAIANRDADQPVRADPSLGAHGPVEQPRAPRLADRHVEHEVGRDQRARRGMEEHDLAEQRVPAEQVLLEHAAPGRLGLVAERRVEAQVLALLGQAGRAVELRVFVGRGVLAREEVMHAARTHDRAHRAEMVERPLRRPVELHGRVQPQAAVGQAHDRHLRAELGDSRRERPLRDPQSGRERSDRFAHARAGSTTILAWASGWPSSSNAQATSSRPTRPVIRGATSILPSEIALSVSANSFGR
jgi:AcrR family transcriptional regulator